MRPHKYLNLNFINPLILALLGCGLVHLSWQKWANITLNYGRELYTPWRITCGQVLYKDIASLYGPFPPYWNALLFKIFGVSIMTLALFNLLLVMGITALIYRFFSDTMDRRTALFSSTAFLSIIAFNQSNGEQGLFAYICPYSYSVTYAIFFALWAIYLFAAHGRSGKDILWGAIGALIGLTALCRFETFIFLATALAAGLILKGIIGRWTAQQFLKAGALVLGGFLVPVVIAYIYFSLQLPKSQVVLSIFGFNYGWQKILRINYYQSIMGLDNPGHNFIIMLTTAACYSLVVIAFKCLCMGTDRLGKNSLQWQGAVFVLVGLACLARVVAWIFLFPYDQIFRGLPVITIFMVGYLFLFLWRNQRDETKVIRILPLLVMAVWGLLMLTKIFLNVHINSEGFFYAMPAIMLFIVLFQGIVPKYFEKKYPRANFVQILASVSVGLIFVVALKDTVSVYQSRQFSVQGGPDKIICNIISHPENGEIAVFLENADKIISKDSDFVAFPDGEMLNFLTKRINPLPYGIFKPTEIIRFGEQVMLRSFKEHNPDYIVLSNRGWQPIHYPGSGLEADHRQFSSQGIIYPYAIKHWILTNYHPVWPADHQDKDLITILKHSE